MWLFFEGGFVSIVQKPDQHLLCIRSRVAADLDRFAQHCPTLTPTLASTDRDGTDYPFRAWASGEDVARAMARIALRIHYSNFKSRVCRVLGDERAAAYERIHGILKDELQTPAPSWRSAESAR